jgi:hypothetical protein
MSPSERAPSRNNYVNTGTDFISANPMDSDSSDDVVLNSPAEVKLKWRNEQIVKQRLLLANIDGTWRRKQLESCEAANNAQCTFSKLDISWEATLISEFNHSDLDNAIGYVLIDTNKVSSTRHSTPKEKTREKKAFEICPESFEQNCEDSARSLQPTGHPDLPIPCVSGWIAKQRKPRSFGLRLFQTWKSSWFVVVLEGDTLLMNRYDGEAYSTPDKSVRLCPLRCATREPESDGKGRFCFSVAVAGDKRRMLLGAGSSQQAEHWTEVLNSVAHDIRCSASASSSATHVGPS